MTLVWSPGYAPVDEYYASVSLLLYGNGTNGSTTITDNSPSPKTVTAVGNAQISTAQSKFGGASIAFDGTGDFITVPDSSAFVLGLSNEPYTVEFWFFRNQTSSGWLLARGCGAAGWNNTNGYQYYASIFGGVLYWQFYSANSLPSTIQVSGPAGNQ